MNKYREKLHREEALLSFMNWAIENGYGDVRFSQKQYDLIKKYVSEIESKLEQAEIKTKHQADLLEMMDKDYKELQSKLKGSIKKLEQAEKEKKELVEFIKSLLQFVNESMDNDYSLDYPASYNADLILKMEEKLKQIELK